MPETREPFATVLLLPAAMPPTCVPCSDSRGSNGRFAFSYVVFGGGNARATITFGVVKRVSPFGNPAGYEYPAGLKKGCDWSTPSSTIAIFVPCPAVASDGPQSCGAPISAGV